MSFFEHLEELRKRLVASIIAVFASFLLRWSWAPEIFEFLARPDPAGAAARARTSPTPR